jgi:hypothetical protein
MKIATARATRRMTTRTSWANGSGPSAGAARAPCLPGIVAAAPLRPSGRPCRSVAG